MANITKTCGCGTVAVTTSEELVKDALQGCKTCDEKYTFGGFENHKENPNKK